MMNFNFMADFEFMLGFKKEEESESFDIKQIEIEQNPYDIFQCKKNIEDFKQEKDEKISKLEFQMVNSKQKPLFEEYGNDRCNSTTKVKKPTSPKNKANKTFSLKRKKPTKSSSNELLKRKRNRK